VLAGGIGGLGFASRWLYVSHLGMFIASLNRYFSLNCFGDARNHLSQPVFSQRAQSPSDP
jgi:hypothetical protein